MNMQGCIANYNSTVGVNMMFTNGTLQRCIYRYSPLPVLPKGELCWYSPAVHMRTSMATSAMSSVKLYPCAYGDRH